MPQEPQKGSRPAAGPSGPQGDSSPPPETSAKKTKGLGRLVTAKVLGVVVVGLLVLQGAGVAYHIITRREATAPEGEISLGGYSFVANPSEHGPVAKASFDLYVAPVAESNRAVRRRLAEREHRVQQDIEELLREAHGGDFVDPTLGELKRRIQERVNKTLETRGAIADVIITGLDIQRGDRPADNTDS